MEADDPGLVEEARRWSALVEISLREVPELSVWLHDEWPQTPGMVWTAVVDNCLDLDDDGAPRPQYRDVWRRFLRVVEIVEEALDKLGDDPEREEDASELHAFSTSGPVCDVTRSRPGLEQLLRWMGPKTVAAARAEVVAHQLSRGWDESAIDWSSAGTDFSALLVDPQSLMPEPDLA